MKSAEQAYLEKMFPNGRELPNDRLIPCLLMQGEKTEVILLVKADPTSADMLRPANDITLLSSDISVIALEQEGKPRPDLRIGLEMAYPGLTLRFHGTISDEEGKKQAAVAKALLQATRIALVISTYEFEFVSFKAFDWNPATQPKLNDVLEDAANGSQTTH